MDQAEDLLGDSFEQAEAEKEKEKKKEDEQAKEEEDEENDIFDQALSTLPKKGSKRVNFAA